MTFAAPVSALVIGILSIIAPPAAALVVGNPYHSIVVRNSFGLREHVVTEPPEERPDPVTPPPNIQLTGLTNLGGKERVLLEIIEPGKLIQRPILTEGEGIDAIEVLEIDVATGRVQLRVMGVETVLTLQTRQSAVAPTGTPLPRAAALKN